MSEDLGHFTPTRNIKAVWDPEARNIKLLHPDSNGIILSLSYDAAELLGKDLIDGAFVAKKLEH